MNVRHQLQNLALARELRRVVMILKGESWRDTYEDLVIDHPQLPGADELEWIDSYGVNEDQEEMFT